MISEKNASTKTYSPQQQGKRFIVERRKGKTAHSPSGNQRRLPKSLREKKEQMYYPKQTTPRRKPP